MKMLFNPLVPLTVALALFLAVGPARADGFYLEPRFGVEVTDLDNVEDGMIARLAAGWDFEPVRLEAEYGWGNNADDEIAAMVFYDFRFDSAFTPYLGAGAGAMLEDVRDFEFGGAFWKVGAGVAFGLSDRVDLTAGYSYRKEFDGNADRSEITLGTRIRF